MCQTPAVKRSEDAGEVRKARVKRKQEVASALTAIAQRTNAAAQVSLEAAETPRRFGEVEVTGKTPGEEKP